MAQSGGGEGIATSPLHLSRWERRGQGHSPAAGHWSHSREPNDQGDLEGGLEPTAHISGGRGTWQGSQNEGR